jgi:CspA family cold shock protein
MNGKCKWFNDAKGYGFITDDTTGKDIFVHFSGIVMEGYKSLKEADSVTYEVRAGTKGPIAIEVKKI